MTAPNASRDQETQREIVVARELIPGSHIVASDSGTATVFEVRHVEEHLDEQGRARVVIVCRGGAVLRFDADRRVVLATREEVADAIAGELLDELYRGLRALAARAADARVRLSTFASTVDVAVESVAEVERIAAVLALPIEQYEKTAHARWEWPSEYGTGHRLSVRFVAFREGA